MTRVSSMNDEHLASLKRVIDYLYHEEEKHWEELGKPDDHIFAHLINLQELVTVVEWWKEKDKGTDYKDAIDKVVNNE